ncbi:DUF2993 domain-containing protein [Rathayibacter sp. YIM 133350]|uniref:LmeA family phospholipid-binding protein n=1 Tax=Rathayibacter sp. YIM 133350 TaxID=3131992 RepID=UPI00307E3ECE
MSAFAGTDAAAPPRRRRWPWVLGIALVLVVALVAAFFIVDATLRGVAETRVRDEIVQQIPGASADEVHVQIGGASVIAQYLSGRFERIDLTGSGVEVGGVSLNAKVRAEGVPVDTSKPVDTVKGVVNLDEKAVNALLAAAGRNDTVTLGAGTVTYEVTRTFLGIPLTFTVTAVPTAAGDAITFTPKSAEAAAGGVSLDVSSLVDQVVSSEGFSVCIADSLPQGVRLDDVTVTPKALTAAFSAREFVLKDAGTTGSC